MTVLVTGLMISGQLYGSSGAIQTSNNIQLSVTDYTQNPSHTLVHSETPITASMVMSKGVHPVKIALTNNGTRPVVLTKESLKVSLADPYYLSRKFHSLNQFTSSNFFDFIALMVCINCIYYPVTISIPLAWCFWWAGLFPGGPIAFIYWWKTGNKNKTMTAAFMRDLVMFSDKGRVIIYPGQTVQRILLLPKSGVDACTLRIFDESGTQPVAGFPIYLTV
jgi:hypothetical protein